MNRASLRSCSRALSKGPLVSLLLLVGAAATLAQDRGETGGGRGPLAPDSPSATRRAGEGTVLGRVLDSETGAPVGGATVIVVWPAPAEDVEPRQEVQVTDARGVFELASVPPGTYSITFNKPGYRTSTMTNFSVQPDRLNRVEFPLPPLPTGISARAPAPEEFVVEATAVDELISGLEQRMESDELINLMSAEELSRFAASDVAEALKRVAGLNVVEGQFAIIRGLEDRYSSTLYNSAPVPSPDPDRQSVQLDLFPSEVVSNLVVAKTFGPDLPSNSSGGSINVVTLEYPEEFELQLKAGTGFNDNAWDRFLKFSDGSPIGSEEDGSDLLESELGASIGGRGELAGREIRYRGLLNREIDYETGEGFQEAREPRRAQVKNFPRPPRVVSSGGLGLGELSLTAGRFDLTESERAEQDTAYAGIGLDLDREGDHRIDVSFFYTRKDREVVQLKENGFLPSFDYGRLAELQASGSEIGSSDFEGFATNTSWLRDVRPTPDDPPSRGPLWSASFLESKSFEIERDLTVSQLNGSHWIEALEGLRLSWAASYAKTTQEERALGARYFFEPEDAGQIPDEDDFPVRPEDLGPGGFAANDGIFSSTNEIEEDQRFARLDALYEAELSRVIAVELTAGGWYEHATRDVDSSFLESPSVEGSSQFAIHGDTQEELGHRIFLALDGAQGGPPSGTRETTNESEREVRAWSLGSKATLWDKVDLLGGFRVERIFIESRNDAFIGEEKFGTEDTFPTRYLFFDRLDNYLDPSRPEVQDPAPPGTTFNDQILGIDVPVDPATGFVDLRDRGAVESLINGEVDESRVLPSLGITYRPIEGLSLRGAHSRTVARPSFREMGFYVSVEPGTDDLIVGNPQLGLSEVESWDVRAECTWGDLGDLFAVSGFAKTIEDPIESIIVRNPLNLEGSSSALFRTFFNNPNEASLRGVELEARKNLGFLGPSFASYVSVGGNFTYIDAEVDRVGIELARSEGFFPTAEGDPQRFSGLERSRRLFGQPEWIANLDVTFDQPDWGTKATLAYFAISDVLDAAGSATVAPSGEVISFVPDRYVDSYGQLDLILSQTWRSWIFKISIKNLTDSTRRIIYDADQTRRTIAERSLRVGRDLSFSVTWRF